MAACSIAGLLATLFASAGLAAQPNVGDGPADQGTIPNPSPVEQSPQHGCFTSQEIRSWFKPIGQIHVSGPPASGEMPPDCSQGLFTPPCREPFRRAINYRCTFHWVAADMAHQPLYWDDQPLERYGQSVCPLAQPVLSGVHFFATFPVIPYEIGLDGTHDLIYTLGYYRAGDCTRPRGSGCRSNGTPR